MAYPTTIPVRLFKEGEYAVINGEKYVPERTCHLIGTIYQKYEGGYAGFEYEHELSCGHVAIDSYGDTPNYCPNCGAKVVEE